MLSNSSKYAIRSVIYLANKYDSNKKYSSKFIAEEIDIPAPFLAKTLQTLVKNKIISSTKGPNGGFYLSETNINLNIMNVIEAIDGLEKINSCYLGLHTCSNESPCAIHHLMAPFRENFLKEISSKTILEFAKENNRTHLKL